MSHSVLYITLDIGKPRREGSDKPMRTVLDLVVNHACKKVLRTSYRSGSERYFCLNRGSPGSNNSALLVPGEGVGSKLEILKLLTNPASNRYEYCLNLIKNPILHRFEGFADVEPITNIFDQNGPEATDDLLEREIRHQVTSFVQNVDLPANWACLSSNQFWLWNYKENRLINVRDIQDFYRSRLPLAFDGERLLMMNSTGLSILEVYPRNKAFLAKPGLSGLSRVSEYTKQISEKAFEFEAEDVFVVESLGLTFMVNKKSLVVTAGEARGPQCLPSGRSGDAGGGKGLVTGVKQGGIQNVVFLADFDNFERNYSTKSSQLDSCLFDIVLHEGQDLEQKETHQNPKFVVVLRRRYKGIKAASNVPEPPEVPEVPERTELFKFEIDLSNPKMMSKGPQSYYPMTEEILEYQFLNNADSKVTSEGIFLRCEKNENFKPLIEVPDDMNLLGASFSENGSHLFTLSVQKSDLPNKEAGFEEGTKAEDLEASKVPLRRTASLKDPTSISVYIEKKRKDSLSEEDEKFWKKTKTKPNKKVENREFELIFEVYEVSRGQDEELTTLNRVSRVPIIYKMLKTTNSFQDLKFSIRASTNPQAVSLISYLKDGRKRSNSSSKKPIDFKFLKICAFKYETRKAEKDTEKVNLSCLTPDLSKNGLPQQATFQTQVLNKLERDPKIELRVEDIQVINDSTLALSIAKQLYVIDLGKVNISFRFLKYLENGTKRRLRFSVMKERVYMFREQRYLTSIMSVLKRGLSNK